MTTRDVTMLFTDIEGSTRMLDGLGEAYAGVLATHHKALRDAFGPRGGEEVGTAGDAFFVVFDSAADAVAAAVAAQRTLAHTDVRVRMGVHRGEVSFTDTGYVGMEIHLAARIEDAAHGGQILISHAVRDALGHDVDVRDLGEHRLKDIAEPQWLYQVLIPGLPSDFPPLRTLSASNLPLPAHRLIGREAELAEVISAVAEHRLVTITGSGGVGKTRLGVQAGIELVDAFPNGVFFCGLAAIPSPDMVAPAVIAALGIRSGSGDDPGAALAEHLRSRRVLLVLDNFEHVLGAADLVTTILETARNVKILVTSREPLHVSAEYEYPLLPLETDAAVSLFEERTAANTEGSLVVADLCRRLDGLPLAIELAAARSKSLTPEAMLERISDALPLLTDGPRDQPARQQTLRATIDWSYGLLRSEEQALLRRLSVFAGGGTPAALAAVCGDDGRLVSSLVDKSLVRVHGGAEPRYWMLRTIREYAAHHLQAADEEIDARESLAAWLEAQARLAAPQFFRREQLDWIRRLQTEDETIRDTVEWCLDHGQPSTAVRIVSLLVDYWDVVGSYAEVVRWLERGLDTASVDAEWQARANVALSLAAIQAGRLDVARGAAEAAVTLTEDTGGDTTLRARALHTLAGVAIAEEEYDEAEKLAGEALEAAREADDRTLIAFALNCQAIAAFEHGHGERAQQLFAEVAENLRRTGDRRSTGALIANLGVAALLNGDYQASADSFQNAITLSEELGERGRLPGQRIDLAMALVLQGRTDEAADQLALALPDAASLGDVRDLISGIICTACICEARGDDRMAAAFLGCAQASARDHDYPISGPDLVLERELAGARDRLGDTAWTAAILQGGIQSLKDASTRALEVALAAQA